ncbi:hypothetical protein HA402_010797 [Bradysia odoriphaga]|nr:hypothetical protein HA402_010797 [Bradysia odoriphaga]
MNFPVNFNTNEPSKFNVDTLTTLKLVKKYNPSFVTTFIVDRKEAHNLTGDDLRKCENMITYKKKKEINAKYSGLLKSKIKTASYDFRNKKRPKTPRQGSAKMSARVEKPKTPRLGSARSQSMGDKDVKSKNMKLRQENVDKKRIKNMKEIFKSNVYMNHSASTIDGSVKSPIGHLATPKDIIEKSGSKVKSFWNLQKSTNTLTKADNNKIEISLDKRTVQHETNSCGDHITVTLKSKAEETQSRKAQINTLKISRRSCFSLLNISSSSDCKVLYKNCFLCNRRKDLKVFSNKTNSPKFRYGAAVAPDTFAEKRLVLQLRSTLIGFMTTEYPIHRVENATAAHTIEERFAITEAYVKTGLGNILGCMIGRLSNYFVVSEVKSVGKGIAFASKLSYKVTFLVLVTILSFYIIYLLYMKFASVFVIK